MIITITITTTKALHMLSLVSTTLKTNEIIIM
jgi:hypothetical protein